MTTAPSSFVKGLEGIVAAQTEMSHIDGTAGILEYVGISIGDLSKHSTFEETVFLLWNKRLPNASELESFNNDLRANYALPDGFIERINSLPTSAEPMHMLRTMVSALAMYDSNPNDNSVEAARAKALKILGCAPAIVAAFDRHRRGLDFGRARHLASPSPPTSSTCSTARSPPRRWSRAFDICMITHADHGLNNSTFHRTRDHLHPQRYVLRDDRRDRLAARPVARRRQRGRDEDAQRDPTRWIEVEAYVMGMIERKERIMGFGHRVYKAKDPRAAELMTLAKQLADDTGNSDLYEKSHKIEQVMEREYAAKGIYPNVDFYSATTYHCIGLKLDLFTPMFALSRIAGWSGHVIEQLADNRLFRPKAEYVGDHDVPYTPISER